MSNLFHNQIYFKMKTAKTILFTAAALLFCLPAFAQLKVDATGRVGIGISDPIRKLEVVGVMMVSNNTTLGVEKQSNFQMRHYDSPTTHFNFFLGQSDANNNQVLFGGGAGAQYAATVIGFMTAPNRTTLLGTERMRIDQGGNIRMNTAGAAGGITHELNLITGNASKPGGGSWAMPSDSRIKQNVRSFSDGLEQVMQIEPVYFSYMDGTGFDPKKEYVGIIAQEMQKIAPYTIEEKVVQTQIGDEPIPNMPSSILTYDGTAVTYMLINAVKEQQSMIADRDDKIEELEERLQKIERMLTSTGGTVINNGGTAITNVTLEGTDAAVLKQNAPNPFSENTMIEYVLPRTSFNNAYIQITNIQGALMRKVFLPQEAGPGILNIKARELPAGEYAYSLVIDGRIVDTKKMILVGN